MILTTQNSLNCLKAAELYYLKQKFARVRILQLQVNCPSSLVVVRILSSSPDSPKIPLVRILQINLRPFNIAHRPTLHPMQPQISLQAMSDSY